jgi:long-chain acyl-CoA synthetase
LIISDIHKSSNDQHRTALNFHGLKIDYAQLEDSIEQYARYFAVLGLQPGERVAIAMTNCPEFIYSYLGTVRAGASRCR